MGIVRKVLGPRSKYDKSIPYAYEARVELPAGGAEPLVQHYFSDTLCGLVETLSSESISPGEVKLYGCFRGVEIALETGPCTGEAGEWLARPELCRSLEETYARTLEERYKGHVAKGSCAYEDRERSGHGPF